MEALREHDVVIDDAQLRRWLVLLRRPHELASPDIVALLKAHGRLPSSSSGLAVGHAAVALLTDSIENLRAPEGAAPEQERPHLVLRMCYLEGAKLFQAAARLGLSERQLSRERARAISLLRTELQAPLVDSARPEYRPEPIPSIRGFMPRPGPSRRLRVALERSSLINVHGPPGIGKTSLVAELATEMSASSSVIWYRFRAEVNTSLSTILFEVGDYLASRGKPELSEYLDSVLPDIEPGVATRLVLKGLAGREHLLVFDDYHLVEPDVSIQGFLDTLVTRLDELKIITIGRRRLFQSSAGQSLEVTPFTRTESQALLRQLGVECADQMVRTLHSWTEGNTHLIRLAASWLKTASPEEVVGDMETLTSREEVQTFLLNNVTELLDSDDRAVLEAASIFRDRCSDDALAHVSGRTVGAVLDASLRLVRAYVATRNKDGDSAFFHGTVRDYVYDRLDPAQRAELHLRAASWYRKQGDTAEAAYHRSMGAKAEQEIV